MPNYPQMNPQSSQPEHGHARNLELVDMPERAGFMRRWGAIIIDSLILMGGCFLVFAPILFGLYMMLPKEIVESVTGLVSGLLQLAFIPVAWLYDAWFTASEKQATPGKRMLGLYVTDLNGNRLTFARATGRYFARILCQFTFNIGYLMAAFTEKKQGLHDIVAGTLVYKGKVPQSDKVHQLIR